MKHILIKAITFLSIFACLLLTEVAHSKDSNSGTRWAKAFFTNKDVGEPVITKTSDGGLALLGKAKSETDDDDIFLMKISPDGKIEWQTFLRNSYPKTITSLIQTRDGGYVCTGGQSADQEFGEALMMRFDSRGALLWQHLYSGALDEHLSKVVEDDAGNLVAVGATSSFAFKYNEANGLIMKLNPKGEILWQRHYGGESGDGFFSLLIEKDGYLLGGETSSYGSGHDDFWLVRINDAGNILWQKTYGGSGADVGYDLQKTKDGNYLFAGTTTSFKKGTGADTWIFKLTLSGDVIWQKVLADPRDVTFSKLLEGADGSFLVAGDAYFKSPTMGNDTHATLLKINPAGNVIWQKRLNSASNEQIWPNAHSMINFGGNEFALAGISLSFNDSGSIFIARITEDALKTQKDSAFAISAPAFQTTNSTGRFGPSGLKMIDSKFQIVAGKFESKDIAKALLGK